MLTVVILDKMGWVAFGGPDVVAIARINDLGGWHFEEGEAS